jgi:hypothetical protein
MENWQRYSIPWQFSVVDKCFEENKTFSIETSSYEQNIFFRDFFVIFPWKNIFSLPQIKLVPFYWNVLKMGL